MSKKQNETQVKGKKKKQSNGAGSITHRKDGTWMSRVSTGYDSDGKLKRQTFYGKTEKEVREKMVKVMHELNTGTYTEPNKITISEWLDIWLNEYKKPSVRQSTYTSYELNTRRHIKPYIGKLQLKDLRTDQIQKMYNNLSMSGHEDGKSGLSPKTIRNIHNALHEALEQALDNGLITRNVTDATTLPRRIKPEIRVLSVEEQIRFLKEIQGDRLEMAFRLDLATGLRLGELLALSWNDIDLNNGVIRVCRSLSRVKTFDDKNSTKTQLTFHETKTKSGQRSISLPEPIIDDLRLYKQRHDILNKSLGSGNELSLVFLSEAGTPIDPRSFIRKFHSIIKKAELSHANVHCMRHTFATRLLEAGVQAKVVSEMLGHANIAITLDTYSHVLPDTKKSASNKLVYLFERKIDISSPVNEDSVPYLTICS